MLDRMIFNFYYNYFETLIFIILSNLLAFMMRANKYFNRK